MLKLNLILIKRLLFNKEAEELGINYRVKRAHHQKWRGKSVNNLKVKNHFQKEKVQKNHLIKL